jgi:hypothetical protein
MNHKRDVQFVKTLADPALRMRAIRRWQHYRHILKYSAMLLLAAPLALAIANCHFAITISMLLAAILNIVLLISIDIKIKLAFVEDRPPY